MRKILFIVTAIAAISFTACCNKTQNNCENDSTCAEACACDPCECDPCECGEATCCTEAHFCPKALSEAIEAKDATTFQQKVEEAKAVIAQLIEQGKTEEAAQYTEQLKQFVAENQERIAEFASGNVTVNTLVENVANLPTDVASLATALGVQAKDAAVGAKDAVEGAAADVAAAGQQKLDAARDAANQQATDAVEAGKQKASDAIDGAAADVKSKLGL